MKKKGEKSPSLVGGFGRKDTGKQAEKREILDRIRKQIIEAER